MATPSRPNIEIQIPEAKGLANWIRTLSGFAVMPKTRWMINNEEQVNQTSGQTLTIAKLDGSTIIKVPVDRIYDTFFSPIVGQSEQGDLIVRLKRGSVKGNPDIGEVYAGTFHIGDPNDAPFKRVRDFLKQHDLN